MKATLRGIASDNRMAYRGDYNSLEACMLGRENLHISPLVSTSKFVFQTLDEGDLVLEAEAPAGGCLPSSPIPSFTR